MTKKLAKNARAAAGGGRAVSINPASFTPQFSYSLNGNNQGANWFGAGEPMAPQAPKEVRGRAFDYPASVNIINQPRSGNVFGFTALRAFADNYDLLRIVIEGRKDQMDRLSWVVQPVDNKQKITPQMKTRIKAVTKLLKKPDGEHKFKIWLRMILEDLFVIDAVSIYKRKTVGGTPVSFDQVDGATITRIIDDEGRTPEDPNETSYQQYLKGMPAVNYSTNTLMYRPRNPRINKLYGYSPVEQIMMTINIAIRRQIFQLNYFTEGNIPQALIGVPDTWTPDQIRVFQEWFDNILAGNLAEKRKARFVPSAVGKTYIPTQETELFGAAEEWLARVTCYAFSTNPEPFIKTTNRAVPGSVSEQTNAEGLDATKCYIKDLVDEIIQDELGEDDLEFIWKGDDELDPAKRQLITSGYLKDGLITVNEGRVDMGREPYDDPIFDKPMIMTSNGLAPAIQPEPDKVDENGQPIAPGANGPNHENGVATLDGGDNKSTGGKGNTGPHSLAMNKVYELIESGDEAELARLLSSLNPGALPMMQGAEHE